MRAPGEIQWHQTCFNLSTLALEPPWWQCKYTFIPLTLMAQDASKNSHLLRTWQAKQQRLLQRLTLKQASSSVDTKQMCLNQTSTAHAERWRVPSVSILASWLKFKSFKSVSLCIVHTDTHPLTHLLSTLLLHNQGGHSGILHISLRDLGKTANTKRERRKGKKKQKLY